MLSSEPLCWNGSVDTHDACVLARSPAHRQLEAEGIEHPTKRSHGGVAHPSLEVDEDARADAAELRVLGLGLVGHPPHEPAGVREIEVALLHPLTVPTACQALQGSRGRGHGANVAHRRLGATTARSGLRRDDRQSGKVRPIAGRIAREQGHATDDGVRTHIEVGHR